MPIPLPSQDEQRAIVARVAALLVGVAGCETAIRGSQRRVPHLRQSILAHAFQGRLVPQDPNDEPASVLLARIRAERESEAKKPRPKTKRPRKKAPSA